MFFLPKLNRTIAIGSATLAIATGAYGLFGATVSSAAVTTTSITTGSTSSVHVGLFTKPTNARSGPEEGGTVGKVTSVSTSGFTVLTSAAEKVTVKVTASTKYETGNSATSASAVTKGETILVMGVDNNTTITAKEIIVEPANSTFTAKTKDVPFKKGAPSTTKQIGTIPANYKQGAGSIVTGTTADNATTAALSAYPGGIIDRVVKISSTEYEVHNIGVNWPHHIFVNLTFKVVGAN